MNGNAGKWVIIAGFIIVAIGVIIYFFHNKLHWIGNLPGDIKIERENFRFYFPLTTMLLVSLLINVVIRIVKWLN
jgi:magnesium-transporting ATPase (P-type)